MGLITVPPREAWLVVRRATCADCPHYAGPGRNADEARCEVLYEQRVPADFARTCSVTPLPIEALPTGPEQPQLIVA